MAIDKSSADTFRTSEQRLNYFRPDRAPWAAETEQHRLPHLSDPLESRHFFDNGPVAGWWGVAGVNSEGSFPRDFIPQGDRKRGIAGKREAFTEKFPSSLNISISILFPRRGYQRAELPFTKKDIEPANYFLPGPATSSSAGGSDRHDLRPDVFLTT